MINLHGISRGSFDLIVEFEVSGKAAYDKKYRRPERPGGDSGITVGIGYDCGYATAADIRRDWGGKIPAAMVTALVAVAGLKGAAAQKALAGVRPKVDVPWEAAIDVFSNVSIPKYMAMARKGLPGFDDLTPDCKGALLSLVYNRGASFSKVGARYAEMRAIRAAMVSGDLGEIPAQLRKMKRLWTTASVRGVALRREQEARLFERGLKAAAGRLVAEPEMEDDATEVAPIDPQAPTAEFDPALLSIQTDLKAMNYSPGIPSGKWGGMTAGALAGFINDHSSATTAPASYDDFAVTRTELLEEIAEAKAEGFKRPVTEARASADPKTVAEVAPESVPVKRGFWAAVSAAVSTAVASVWDWIGGTLSATWDFFTDNKDSIPTDPDTVSTLWSYISAVPPIVWGFALCGVFVFIALQMRGAGNQITESVKTGARQ